MTRTVSWRTFDKLSREYKQLQIEILQSVEFDNFGSKALVKWGETLIPALVKAHKVVDCDFDSDPLDISHWAVVRELAFSQLTEIINILKELLLESDYDEEARVSPFDKAIIFNFVNRVSTTYYDVAQELKMLEGNAREQILDIAENDLKEILDFAEY